MSLIYSETDENQKEKKSEDVKEDQINDIEKFKFFRTFLWHLYSDVYHWKSLAQSIYHIHHLINNLDNYQIKHFIENQCQNLLNQFNLFMKELITIQTKSQQQEKLLEKNDPTVSANSETNLIEEHIQNLKTQLNTLKELISTAQQRFNLCKTDINALEKILQAIENINFNCKTFDKQDQSKIHLLSLKEKLSEKSSKTDLIQMKTYIDNQIKNLIELNKQNAKELERIKLLKTSTCHARHIQSILSKDPSSMPKTSKKIYGHLSSRPYITYELEHIRQYQRQALVKSPYGTIPLYRRQAWAAANLFPNQSLHFLRYLQNSLRMKIHHLLGYDPSDICNTNKKKKITKKSETEILNKTNDITIVGTNNKLYRGQVESCQTIPLKKSKKSKLKIQSNINENKPMDSINFDQFNQINNQTVNDQHLFEYLDWQLDFNEQDLPDELCEELFRHWTSIVCDDQPCHCDSETKTTQSETKSGSSYDERCICSQCSCSCEKDLDEKSICLCSQCSCQCLHENFENLPEILENDTTIPEELPTIISHQPSPIAEETNENEDEINISDCFLNRTDQWTKQFDYIQPSKDFNHIYDSLELDDPTIYRKKILKT